MEGLHQREDSILFSTSFYLLRVICSMSFNINNVYIQLHVYYREILIITCSEKHKCLLNTLHIYMLFNLQKHLKKYHNLEL